MGKGTVLCGIVLFRGSVPLFCDASKATRVANHNTTFNLIKLARAP